MIIKNITKLVATVSAFSIIITSCPVKALAAADESNLDRKQSILENSQHQDISFNDMKYVGYDSEGFLQKISELDGYLQQRRKWNEIKTLYDELLYETEVISTQAAIADIKYYQNIFDEYWQNQSREIVLIQTDLLDKFSVMIAKILDSSEYWENFQSYIGYDRASMYYGYEGISDEAMEMYEEELSLIQQYESISSQEYETSYELAESVAEIYIQLFKERKDTAVEMGYSSYADYANYYNYYRDYSVNDMKKIFDSVKKYIVPLYSELGKNYTSEYRRASLKYIPPKTPELMGLIGENMNDISPKLKESWDYLIKNNLYDIDYSDTKPDVGFTISLPQWNSAFIFNSPYDDIYDISTIIHEFGHFTREYYDNTPVMFSISPYDLLEVHSQAMEVLYTQFYTELFGEELKDAMTYDLIYTLVNTIVNYSYLAELEVKIYSQRTLTKEKIYDLSSEIMASYGADPKNEETKYHWAYYSHITSNPMYSISYVTSALAALDLWVQSQVDYDFASESYITLMGLDNSWFFQEALAESGFNNVFDKKHLGELADNISVLLIKGRTLSDKDVQLKRPRSFSYDDTGNDNAAAAESFPSTSQASQKIKNSAQSYAPVFIALVVLVASYIRRQKTR